ncbi:MAG TPA: sugar phosphate isomerase/epimerase family protein [Bryobacteraceae bacterium]|nr:sugar phosphate isomerase/epimerase family protein [Bryobacteraceae bacterium]
MNCSALMVEASSRRRFLGGLAAGLLTAEAAFGKPRNIDITRFSAITDECAKSPAEAIAFAKKYGLQFVELRGVPGARMSYEALPDDQLRQAAQEFRGAGLRVSFLDAGLYKYSLPGTEPLRRTPEAPEARARRIKRDGESFERRMELLNRALNAAKILGTDKVRVFTFLRVAEPMALLPRIAGILEPMVEVARKQKITLLIENESSCNAATCVELAEMMKLLPSKWIGINWDPHNGFAHKEIPFPDGYRLLPKKRLGNVQIKGRSLLTEFPDRFDWKAIFDTMLADGYKGHFGLETHIFGEEQIRRSHECMQEIHRLIGSRPPAA